MFTTMRKGKGSLYSDVAHAQLFSVVIIAGLLVYTHHQFISRNLIYINRLEICACLSYCDQIICYASVTVLIVQSVYKCISNELVFFASIIY